MVTSILEKIQLSPSNPFNLDATLCCGQAFRWQKRREWWYGVVGQRAFKLCQSDYELALENADKSFVENYLRLHDDLTRIASLISKDEYAEKAVKTFRGLRILRQDPWECLISYICATYKNIAAIRHMIHKLSKKLGNALRFENQDFFGFPTAKALAEASVSDLAKCGLGYRAKYVSQTAKLVHRESFDLERLRKMKYDEARTALLDFPGVGPKVADCILLFSLEKLEAFPVDVWMKRVILEHYRDHFASEFINRISDEKSLGRMQYDRLSAFGREYFGKYAGYAQEYLYHYERTMSHC